MIIETLKTLSFPIAIAIAMLAFGMGGMSEADATTAAACCGDYKEWEPAPDGGICWETLPCDPKFDICCQIEDPEQT